MTTPESRVIGSKVLVGLKDDNSSNNTSRTSSIISFQDTPAHSGPSHDARRYSDDSDEEYQVGSASDLNSDDYEYEEGQEEEEEEEEEEHDSGLIVPRISVQEGNERLRILVCGDSGIGKTKLIRTALSVSLSALSGDSRDDRNDVISEPVLDENGFVIHSNQDILFVDTPGYGACLDAQQVIQHVAGYVEKQFEMTRRLLNPNITEDQDHQLLRRLVSAHGATSHLDCCVYVILNRVKPVDREYMRTLQDLCNLVPLIIMDHKKGIDLAQQRVRHDLEGLDTLQPVFSSSERSFINLINATLLPRASALRQSTASKFLEWRNRRRRSDDQMHLSRYLDAQHHAMLQRVRDFKDALRSSERSTRLALAMNELSRLDQEEAICAEDTGRARQAPQRSQHGRESPRWSSSPAVTWVSVDCTYIIYSLFVLICAIHLLHWLYFLWEWTTGII
ncbi:hypothetical protein BCR43DRAFT_484983 [Syncephalastrum racemosum]|uniref:Septin-type G domain-containing protein n=1 Tax=Syncephalastrum racemosum TaxID=13706 RepID=A0A1X2HLM2_SYNRA|nr:hypothetical protein BCR43DRAFT_484983 [Syncephalastrum racemosum]